MNLLTINEIAQKLDEWAKRREHKLPEHPGHISFYGSLLKALGNSPDLVLTWLQSRMPEQLNSIQKDLDDLYKKAKDVDHERSESGGETNILKCQAHAAAARLAKKLCLLQGIVESHREQFEISEKPAETVGNATPTKWWGITTFKNIIEKGWQIFTKSFWDSVFERWGPK